MRNRLLLPLALLVLTTTLAGCGATANTGAASEVQNFHLDSFAEDGGLNISWQAPASNWNPDAVLQSSTNNSSPWFYIEFQDVKGKKILETTGHTRNDEPINDTKFTVDGTKYSLSIGPSWGLQFFNSLKVSIYGYNEFKSGPAKVFAIENVPSVTQVPTLDAPFVTKNDISDPYFMVCAHGDHDATWKNRESSIKLQMSGANNLTFETNDPNQLSGCFSFPPNKLKVGKTTFSVVASNSLGKSEPVTSTIDLKIASRSTTTSIIHENPWNRTFSNTQSESIAKTTWCIEKGWRNYDWSKDECTNTLSR